MTRLPPVVILLGMFGLLALGLYAYAKNEPPPLPMANLLWKTADDIRNDLSQRKQVVAPNASQERNTPPYRVTIERLEDVIPAGRERSVARYVLRVRAAESLPVLKQWFGHAADFGLLDLAPESPVGDIRWVALRKVDIDDRRFQP